MKCLVKEAREKCQCEDCKQHKKLYESYINESYMKLLIDFEAMKFLDNTRKEVLTK